MIRNHRQNLVIIGTGMAARRFVEELMEIDGASKFDVAVVGGESNPSFDWLHRRSWNDVTADSVWPAGTRSNGHTLMPLLESRVRRINRRRKQVATSDENLLPYDILVFATGASPVLPDIEGSELQGVFTYQREEDLEVVKDLATRSRRATVLGGGLLGLKAAEACVAAGVETTLLEYGDRLMPRQLNDKDGLVNGYMTSLGIKVRTDARPKCFTGHERVDCIRLIGDSMIPTDLVIVCAEMRPNDQSAAAAGIPVADEGGIIVDSRLRTADPDIFAIGECASLGGQVCGLVSPGFSMAAVLAGNLSGQTTQFKGPDIEVKLRHLGVDPARFDNLFNTRPTRPLIVPSGVVDRPTVF